MLLSTRVLSPSISSTSQPWLLRLLTALLLVGVLNFLVSSPALAQNRQGSTKKKAASGGGGGGGAGYTTGLGLRAGSPAGITIKHFFKGPVAVEAIVGTNFNRRGLNLTVLLEKHGPAFQSRGLQWYYGLGGHVSSYTGAYYYDWYYVKHKGNKYYYARDEYYTGRFWGLGIDGVLGLEYLFSDLPFTLGVDAKPFAELTRGDAFFGMEGALSLRYAF
ncbi:MAG: hypothetical protein H7330_03475 [Hymenobacteraceae bacterium]|nr:hypothetical protein [Hymenobacteraceae bacterium]